MMQSPTGPVAQRLPGCSSRTSPKKTHGTLQNLVEALNPSHDRHIPTTKIPNQWHFSLHPIPTHSMAIFLVNPCCQFIHIETLSPYSRELSESLGTSNSN